MKILKLIKDSYGNYKAVFDEIPKVTYEQVANGDYVGSSVNDNGDIIASHWLERRGYGDAFGGRNINLNMKDGSTRTIKDYWFDNGSYQKHGYFMSIGAGTLEGLQECYVYSSYYINVDTFEGMVEEYLSRDKIYGYREVEDWCKLQYKWYDVIVNGKKIPYMMNYRGEMVEKESKKRVSPRRNVMKRMHGHYKEFNFFRFEYVEDGALKKVDANYLETLKATLPYSEEEIRRNCKLTSIEKEEEINLRIKAVKTVNSMSLVDKRAILNHLQKELGLSENA